MKSQWIEYEDDVWVHTEKDISIELYSGFESSTVRFISGEAAQTRTFKTRKEALECIRNVIKPNATLTESFK